MHEGRIPASHGFENVFRCKKQKVIYSPPQDIGVWLRALQD